MKTLRFAKNYTPHAITLRPHEGTEVEFAVVGTCRAVERTTCDHVYNVTWDTVTQRGNWAGAQPKGDVVVVNPPQYSGVEWKNRHGDPSAPDEGGAVIVSIIAAPVAASARPDLTVYVPDTSPASAVRTKEGWIEAVRRMILWHKPLQDRDIVQAERLLNPANPGDGCEILGTWELSHRGIRAALELAAKTGDCVSVNDRQPMFAGGHDVASVIERYGLPEHLSPSGQARI